MSWTSVKDALPASATVRAFAEAAYTGIPDEVRVQSNAPMAKHEAMLFFLRIVYLLAALL